MTNRLSNLLAQVVAVVAVVAIVGFVLFLLATLVVGLYQSVWVR